MRDFNYLQPGGDIHTYAQDMPFVALFICSFSNKKKEKEAGERSSRSVGGLVVQEEEGNGRETGRKRDSFDRRAEEGTEWKKRPVTTIQLACIGGSVMSVHWYHQPHCLMSNREIQFLYTFTEATQLYTAFYTAFVLFFFFATHFQIKSI